MSTHDEPVDQRRREGAGRGDDERGYDQHGQDERRYDERGHDPRTYDGPGPAGSRADAAYGGIKWGSAFFGWLSAMGLAVLLTALVAAIGAAVGVSQGTEVDAATEQAAQNPETIGIAGGIALAVILCIAYFCGGYVAGRMARFNGTKQGLAVWIWAILIAAVVAIVAAVAGSQYDVLSALNSFPRIPVNQGDLTTGGIIALAVVLVVSLVGALLGGAAGMRFHRRVDRAELGV